MNLPPRAGNGRKCTADSDRTGSEDKTARGFDNGDIVLMLLQQVLAGTLRSGALWSTLRQFQRYVDVAGAWPDFGSGGMSRRGGGRPPRGKGPTWHWPGKIGGGKGFKLPSGGGGGRGRGGFRTGGGF